MNDWKRIVKNNLTIALNILYIKGKKCRLYLIESYNEEYDEGYFVELMFNILKTTCASYFIMNYHFYLKERKLEKSESLSLIYIIKIQYVMHIRNLQVALNHGLNLSKFHRVIKFNQNAWLKPYISTNTKIRKSKR